MTNGFMAQNLLHTVYVLQREGMTKIVAHGLCRAKADEGLAIYQVPDWVFDGRAKYGEMPICPKCSGIVKQMQTPPPK